MFGSFESERIASQPLRIEAPGVCLKLLHGHNILPAVLVELYLESGHNISSYRWILVLQGEEEVVLHPLWLSEMTVCCGCN